MKVNSHNLTKCLTAELSSDQLIIKNIEDTTDLIGNLYYQGFGGVIIYEKNIVPDFFDLKTGIAGEILQKFSNFQIRLVIVGDFSQVKSKSLKDFIRESNRGNLVNFVDSLAEAFTKLTKS